MRAKKVQKGVRKTDIAAVMSEANRGHLKKRWWLIPWKGY